MNITSNYPQVPLSTVNPATQQVRQENMVREAIKQPAQAEPFPREPGIAKEHEAQRNQSKELKQRFHGGSESSQSLQDNRYTPQSDIVDSANEDGHSHRHGEQHSGEGDPNTSSQESAQSKGSANEEDSRAQQEKSPQQERAERQEVQQLQSRDQEVRAHEQAHASVGGHLAGAPKLKYETGPDGREYAVAGEVSIDVSPVAGDPEATIQKMRKVRAAALAPADPSPQDIKVASEANRMIVEAQGKMATGDEENSRYRGGSRRLTGEDATSSADASKEDKGDRFVESRMSLRNEVIAGVYQQSSRPTISSTSLAI